MTNTASKLRTTSAAPPSPSTSSGSGDDFNPTTNTDDFVPSTDDEKPFSKRKAPNSGARAHKKPRMANSGKRSRASKTSDDVKQEVGDVPRRKGTFSPEEHAALLEAALGKPAVKQFAGIPGRDAKQCYDVWQRTTLPFLKRALREKKA